jgi:hypothetical protein
MAIWYTPASPEVNAAPTTAAGCPPTFTLTPFSVWMPLGTTWPSGAGGLVGPKPVPHRMIVSPGFAGAVVTPRDPLAAAYVKSTCVATTCFAGQGKKAGWTDCELMANGG